MVGKKRNGGFFNGFDFHCSKNTCYIFFRPAVTKMYMKSKTRNNKSFPFIELENKFQIGRKKII
jgi:hypothetical protein